QVVYFCMVGCALGSIGGPGYPHASGPHLRGTSNTQIRNHTLTPLSEEKTFHRNFSENQLASNIHRSQNVNILRKINQGNINNFKKKDSSNNWENQGQYGSHLNEINFVTIQPTPRNVVTGSSQTNFVTIQPTPRNAVAGNSPTNFVTIQTTPRNVVAGSSPTNFVTPLYSYSNEQRQDFVRTQRETIQGNSGTQTANQIHIIVDPQYKNTNQRFSQENNGNQNYGQVFNSQASQKIILIDDGKRLSHPSNLKNIQPLNISHQNKINNKEYTQHLSNQQDNQHLFESQRTGAHLGVNQITNIKTQINNANERSINLKSRDVIGVKHNLNHQQFQQSINPALHLRIYQDESRQLSNLVNKNQNSILIDNQRNVEDQQTSHSINTKIIHPNTVNQQLIQRIPQKSSIPNTERRIFNTVSQPNNNQNIIPNNQEINQQKIIPLAAGPHLKGGSLTEWERLKLGQRTTGTHQTPFGIQSSSTNLKSNPNTFSADANDNNQKTRIHTGQQNSIQIPNSNNDYEVARITALLNTEFLQRNNNYGTQQSVSADNQPTVQTHTIGDQNGANTEVIRTQRQVGSGNTVQLYNLPTNNFIPQQTVNNQISNQNRNQGFNRQLNNRVTSVPRFQPTTQRSFNNQPRITTIPASNVLLVPNNNRPIASAIQTGFNTAGRQRFGNTQTGIRSQQTTSVSGQSNFGQSNQQPRHTVGPVVTNVEDIRDGPHADGSYYFRITNSDGTVREEGGVAIDPCTIRVTGSSQHIAPNGEIVTTQFISDHNGYQSFNAGT
ncbi:unnamed protein product, partial [Meganyctiphanes norvegica]